MAKQPEVKTYINESGQTVAMDSNGSWKVYSPVSGKYGAYAKAPKVEAMVNAPAGVIPHEPVADHSEIGQLRQEVAALADKVSEAIGAKNTAEAHADHVTLRNGELIKCRDDLATALTSAEHELEATTSERDTLKIDKANLESSLTQKESELSAAQTEIGELRTSLDKAHDDLSATTTAIGGLNTTKAQLEETLVHKDGEIVSTREVVDRLNERLDQTLLEVQRLNQTIVGKDNDLLDTGNALQTALGDKTTLESVIAIRDRRVNDLEREIVDVRTAASDAATTAGNRITDLERDSGQKDVRIVELEGRLAARPTAVPPPLPPAATPAPAPAPAVSVVRSPVKPVPMALAAAAVVAAIIGSGFVGAHYFAPAASEQVKVAQAATADCNDKLAKALDAKSTADSKLAEATGKTKEAEAKLATVTGERDSAKASVDSAAVTVASLNTKLSEAKAELEKVREASKPAAEKPKDEPKPDVTSAREPSAPRRLTILSEDSFRTGRPVKRECEPGFKTSPSNRSLCIPQ